MQAPALFAVSTVLGEDLTMTLGFVGLLLGGVVTWAETRFHVASLREKEKAREVEVAALEARIRVLETRTDRTDERVDHVLELLTEVRADVKRLLERRDAA